MWGKDVFKPGNVCLEGITDLDAKFDQYMLLYQNSQKKSIVKPTDSRKVGLSRNS